MFEEAIITALRSISGGGGAILTNDERLADHAKHSTTTAKQSPYRWYYVHGEIGYNFQMPNQNAALGCAQLERSPEFLVSKYRMFGSYQEAFVNIQDVLLMQEPLHCQSNYWLQTLILSENVAMQRDVVLQATNDAGLMARPAWRLLHQLEPYKDCPPAPLLVAKSLAQRVINIPSSAGLA